MRIRAIAVLALAAGVLVLAPARAQEEGELEVPYVPTPENVVAKMLELANVKKADVLYDLGSGDGRIVVTAASKYGVRAVGYDLNPERIQEANENSKKAGVTGKVEFRQKDLFTADLHEASVVTLYLLPSVNLKLRPKLFAELKPGSRVVSHDFDMGDWAPDKTMDLDGHKIYFWVIPADAKNRK
jgi:precorrin-6B methylase 2